MAGKKVYRKNYNNYAGEVMNVNFQNIKISAGAYILNVITDGKGETFKIIKK